MHVEQQFHPPAGPAEKDDHRHYFQPFHGPRHGAGSDRRVSLEPTSRPGQVPAVDEVGSSQPWWRWLPQQGPAASPAPANAAQTALCQGSLSPAAAAGGDCQQQHMRIGAAVRMQAQVMEDLLDATRASKGRGDTPADLLLRMLSDMLLGLQPNLQEVAVARTVLLRHVDPYQPLNLRSQMSEANLDADVVHALMHQLGASGGATQQPGSSAHGQTAPQPGELDDRGFTGAASVPVEELEEEVAVDTLREALALLLALRLPVVEAEPASVEGGSGGSGSSGSDTDGSMQLCSVPPPVLDEVERALALVDSWQYDTWRLAELTQGHALSCLGFYLLHREGLISQFSMKPAKLARLLRAVEAGYAANPYHNSTHAADVLQTLHVLLHGAGLTTHYLDRLGLLAAYFAAIIHDHGHPGLTADFLIATSDPLAVRYNDRSPLENHHGASFFAMLRQTDMDALAQLTAADKAAFRKLVLDLVMATDMKQHFSLLAHFNTAHHLAPYNKDVGPRGMARRPRPSRSGAAPSGDEGVSGAGCGEAVSGATASTAASRDPRPLDDTERLLSLQVALKAADLGHLGEELQVHKRWVRALEEEFFQQGDKEQQLGLPISPLFDRTKQGVSKSQVGFYDFIALPLVHALASTFPGAQPLTACCVSNYDHWRAVEEAAAVQRAPAPQQQPALPVEATELTEV